MPISIVASSSGTQNNTTAAFTIPKPVGTMADDVLVAFVNTTENPSGHTGWVEFAGPLTYSSRQLSGFYKVAGDSEPASYTFKLADATPHSGAGGIYAIRGADTDTPIHVSGTLPNVGPISIFVLPSITTTEANCILLGSCGGHDNATWTTGVMTEAWDVKSTGSSAVNNVGADQQLGAAGATGTRTFTANAATDGAGIICAVAPGCDPIHPDPLFIPFKARLSGLEREFSDASITRAISEQFDNWKSIERWALGFMRDTLAADKCHLRIPYPDHSREPWDVSAGQSFDNWKAVERWASYILDGSCGCNCGTSERLADKCQLFIPHKDALGDIDPLDADDLTRAATEELVNFLALERWGNLYASGECGCTTG